MPYGAPPPAGPGAAPHAGPAAVGAPGSSVTSNAQVGGKLVGFLLSYDVDPRGSFWTLRMGDNKVGRKGATDGLDIEIDHPTVSSNHAVVHVGEHALARIEDMRSANGTLLHDKAIAGQGQRELRDGDRVRFGAVNVIVKLVDPS
jgi:pSer/pThr/pTyr-binding forkhead associated (FHA) protein